MHWDLQNRQTLIGRVSLELSLKPFWDLRQEAVEAVAEELFTQWLPLLRKADSAAVMMWSADGSEILEYDGDLNKPFEWAKWIGMADPNSLTPYNPDEYNLHAKAELYRENPPDITYGDLRRIVAALRTVGERVTDLPVQVGTTFDPGGEFAASDFKFGRHGEIAAHRLDGGVFRWVTCTASLHADTQRYAGFPEGIPEGTHLGTFLGRQARHFLTDLGMDFLWFSNGFAFAANAWSCTGQLFDGERFDNARALSLQRDILRFWELFRVECPDFPIECRGSNLATGMDLSAHGSPLRAIYEGGFQLSAPPNSPWAALDGNYGLELVGWMSHIAQLPEGGKYPFRYYTHDPWWLNSPWFDRYGRQPHDIYLPLALARLDGQGRVTKPTCINFLSADTSYGELPDRCPIDVVTHLVKALDDFPTEPGLATWVYPFDEYHDMVAENRLGEIFFGDWFVTGAVNRGFALSGVVSSRSLKQIVRDGRDVFRGRVLVSIVPDAGSELEASLLACLADGSALMLYGPVEHASPELLRLVGVTPDAPLEGPLRLVSHAQRDVIEAGAPSDMLEHNALYSAGPIQTRWAGDAGVQLMAEAFDAAGEARAYATHRPQALGAGSGDLVWLRGSFNYEIRPRLPKPFDPEARYPADALPRQLLGCLGYEIITNKPGLATREPLLLGARRDNGYYLSGFNPSTTVVTRLRFPEGAPLMIGRETLLRGGYAEYPMPRAWHHECRVLVSGQTEGEISCVESFPLHPTYRRRLLVHGLKNATVRVLPETIQAATLHMDTDPNNDHMPKQSDPYVWEAEGRVAVIGPITGSLRITW